MAKRQNLYCTCCNASGTRRDLTHGDGICECSAYYTTSKMLASVTSGTKATAKLMPDGQVNGTASDGTVVNIGHVFWSNGKEFGADAIESYLTSHSTPDTW
jgi:hypothetical protein